MAEVIVVSSDMQLGGSTLGTNFRFVHVPGERGTTSVMVQPSAPASAEEIAALRDRIRKQG